LDEAKRLLQEAGLAPKDLTHGVTVVAQLATIVEIEVQLLNSALGSALTVQAADRAVTVDRWAQGNFDLAGGFNAGTFPDPAGELGAFAGCSFTINFSRFCGPSADARLTEIDTTLDPTKRVQLSRALEQEMLREWVSWIIPSSSPRPFAWQGRVRGFAGFPHGADGLPAKLERAWLAA
jgi:ABC-type transport system substrate-binding protein